MTTSSDCYYHWKFNPNPSYFHLLTGGRVAVFHEEASHHYNAKHTAINHWSLVPRGRLTRGGGCSTKTPIYIGPTPIPPQIRGRWRDTSPHGRRQGVGARTCPSDPLLGDGGCSVVSWSVRCDKGTVKHHRRRFCILHAEHPWRALLQIKTVRSRYVLVWCLCQYKPYGTIFLTTISFYSYKDNYKLWSFYHFIFEHRQSYCISTEACFEFLVVLILLQLFCFMNFVCYIIYDFVHIALAIQL